jgi:hypothetical protein
MSGHKRTLRMNAKLNRYDLRPWDVGKLPLYGSALTTVQAATLYCLYWVRLFRPNFKVQLPGQARGCSMRMAWITLPQPRRNKPWPSCPRRQVFLRSGHGCSGNDALETWDMRRPVEPIRLLSDFAPMVEDSPLYHCSRYAVPRYHAPERAIG